MVTQFVRKLFTWRVISAMMFVLAGVTMFAFPSYAVYSKASISAGWETGALIATFILCIYTYLDIFFLGEKHIWKIIDPRFQLPFLAVMSAIIAALIVSAFLASGPYEKRLFSVALGLEDQLDSGRIPDSLRTAFDKNNSSLPETVSVSVIEARGEWKIHGGDQNYTVRKGTHALNISDEGGWCHKRFESCERYAGAFFPAYHAGVIVLGAAFSAILSLLMGYVPVNRTAFETKYPGIEASNVFKYTQALFELVRTARLSLGKDRMPFLAFMRTAQFARAEKKCKQEDKKKQINDAKLKDLATGFREDICRLTHEDNIRETEDIEKGLVNLMIENELARTLFRLADIAALVGYICVLLTVWAACRYAAPPNAEELKTFLDGLGMFIGGSVAFGLVIMNSIYVLYRIRSGVSG